MVVTNPDVKWIMNWINSRAKGSRFNFAESEIQKRQLINIIQLRLPYCRSPTWISAEVALHLIGRRLFLVVYEILGDMDAIAPLSHAEELHLVTV